jgi:tRNA pseudouridine synthase 10
MFALLGRGLTNEERGKTIKTMLTMCLHEGIRGGDADSIEVFKKLAPRLGSVASKLYEEISGSQLEEAGMCYICGDRLSRLIVRAAQNAITNLKGYKIRTFLVASRIPSDLASREDEIKRFFGLSYAESIGSEVKREVSKILQRELGLIPDFENPDVIVEVDLSTWSTRVLSMPILIRGVYWKIGRRISQTIWVTRRGERRYAFSVEDGLSVLAELLNAENVVLHASGREDADARMLGTGRPFIVEVKNARIKTVDIATLEKHVNEYSSRLLEFKLHSKARRAEVSEIKGDESKRSKIYKALVVTEEPISDNDLRGLEEFFNKKLVRQRTPARVRHRRPDVIRERIVFSVKNRRIGERVFESLIHAEGGLYIKELVSGDNGDTSPSFAEYLGMNAYCASLDVVAVFGTYPRRV